MKTVKSIVFLQLLLICAAAAAQTTKVDGRVLDAVSSTPLPGVAVYFPGTYIGTATDSLGRFRLEAADTAARAVTAEMLDGVTRGASVPEGVTDPGKVGDKPRSPPGCHWPRNFSRYSFSRTRNASRASPSGHRKPRSA